MANDFDRVLAPLPFGVYVCEAPSGLLTAYNRRAVELWGRTPQTGERYGGALRLLDATGVALGPERSPMAYVLQGGEARADEILIERPDGSRVAAVLSTSPLRDSAGRTTGAVACLQPIVPGTERQRRAERDAAHLAAIVTGADDAIVSKTLDGVVTSWNRAAEAMFGYSAEWMVGRPITTIIPTELLDEEKEILSRLRRGESIEHFETERVARDGRRLPVSLSLSPLRDSQGNIIGASKILRDNSVRRLSETSLKASVQILEVLYRLTDVIGRAPGKKEVCDAGLEAIVSVLKADRASLLAFDDDGLMRFVSWSGLSDGYRAAADGHSPWRPDAQDPRPILIESVLASADLGPLREAIVAEGIRALAFIPLMAGDRLVGKFMLYYDTPHFFSTDEIRLATTIAHHIGFGLDRVRSQAAFERLLLRERSARHEADVARSEAVTANRAKDDFLAMLAHELRNPLGVIVNALAIIDGAAELPPAARHASGMMKRQSTHLSRLLDDLLDVARITQGRIELRRSGLDLRDIVARAVEAQDHRIGSKRQKLSVAVPAAPVWLDGDPVRLQQVVGNLLDNASKYTPSEGELSVNLAVEEQQAVLTVRDNGSGIGADHLGSVFELFNQANPTLARTEGGLGIGLTLVRRIVEMHEGTVAARSEGLGKGAELTVRLPLAARPAAPAESRPAAPASGLKILIVEDNEDGRQSLALMLRLQGHEVLQAETGRKGVDTALQARPDVVLVDIGLPDIDGYSVARALRDRGSESRLVALTGYGQPQDRTLALDAGFDLHLVKPVEPQKLADTLRQFSPSPTV